MLRLSAYALAALFALAGLFRTGNPGRHRPAEVHPAWCVRPVDEEVNGAHVSRKFPTNRNDGVEVALIELWAEQVTLASAVTYLVMAVVEEGERREHVLPVGQARALRVAIAQLLDTVRKGAE